jgi:ferredoxin-type protein NapF
MDLTDIFRPTGPIAMMEDAFTPNRTRRQILFGTEPQQKMPFAAPLRPPWTDTPALVAGCTSCGDCIQACPEGILLKDSDGRPIVDFNAGACSFCGKCAESCDEHLFEDPTTAIAWDLVVQIEQTCLMKQGVECRSCIDSCDTRALTFDYRIPPAGGLNLEAGLCTGCGGCYSVCPVGAISFTQKTRHTEIGS